MGKRMRLTKKEALGIFKEQLQAAIEQGFWTYSKQDKPALRESWNNFTDSLCKDELITERQYDTWSQPF